MAEATLQEVANLAENVGQMAGWRHLPELYTFLAVNYLGQGLVDIALELAIRAHDLAQRRGDVAVIGLTWRALGRVIARLSAEKRPVKVGESRYEAADCFAQSLRVFEQINGGGVASHRDQAQTLWYWALFETATGQPELGERLQKRAESLAQPLGLALVE
jgi:hypothetical protein